MGFFDILNPDERRWRNEARQEAKEYRADAREYMSDAEDYKSDYNELKLDTNRLVNELSGTVRKHNEYKVSIIKELGSDVTNTIDNFKRFNINSRVIKVPKIDSNSMPNIPTFTANNFFMSMPGGNFNPLKVIFNTFSDPYKDRDEAMKQKDKALEYLWEVKSALANLRDTYESLNNTRRYINDERQMLSQLMDKVRSIMQQLNNAMNQQTHTETSAKHMNAVCKIAEQIKNSLETQLINKSGNIDNNYKQYSSRLKQINDSIPARPVISESNSWLDVIINY